MKAWLSPHQREKWLNGFPDPEPRHKSLSQRGCQGRHQSQGLGSVALHQRTQCHIYSPSRQRRALSRAPLSGLPSSCVLQKPRGKWRALYTQFITEKLQEWKKHEVWSSKGLKRRGLCPEEKLSCQAPLEPSKRRDWKQRKVETRTGK